MAPTYEFDVAPGTREYLPTLLAHIRAVLPHPANIQVHPVILQSLLLCLIIGDKNLILRAAEDEIVQVMKLAALVLTTVFGLTTHKLRLHSHMTPDMFMEALLTRPARPSGSRPSMTGSANGQSGVLPHPLSRSSSSPGDVSQTTTSSPGSTRKLPLNRISQTPPDAQTQVPFRRAQTLPEALVVTGLEYVGPPAQRALFKLLVEREIQLNGAITDIPPDALKIVVFIGAWKPSERPKIHSGLLDMFAMSSDVTVPPSLENPRPSPSPSRNSRDATVNPIVASGTLNGFRSLLEDVHVQPALTLYCSDLLTATRHHPELDALLLTTQAHKDAVSLARAHCVLQGETNPLDLLHTASLDNTAPSNADLQNGERNHDWPIQSLDEAAVDIANKPFTVFATQRDVAVTFSRAVTHRLRVRDGPENEVLSSLLYPAVRDRLGSEEQPSRRTVKEILVEILASV